MAPVSTLIPATRARRVPGDDGRTISARDARLVRREEPTALGGPSPMTTTVPAAPAVGGQSLDERLVDAWEGLVTHRSVACPICAGVLRPRYGATSRTPIGGRCETCGSTLS
ncbi:hypothetical protein [Paraconexibacter sp.]|uniref:hypothetical protein n=1 Tax=Paraconexibacter sp. TaxID=2949640 RepID=UPI00356813DB